MDAFCFSCGGEQVEKYQGDGNSNPLVNIQSFVKNDEGADECPKRTGSPDRRNNGNGQVFQCKKASTQLDTTIADFSNTWRCSVAVSLGTNKPVLANSSGDLNDKIIKGVNSKVLATVEKNNTGITALPLTDCFLKMS